MQSVQQQRQSWTFLASPHMWCVQVGHEGSLTGTAEHFFMCYSMRDKCYVMQRSRKCVRLTSWWPMKCLL